MHELALAEAVVSATQATAEGERLSRVLSVDVRIGELQHIHKSTFDQALETIVPQSGLLAGTRFRVSIVPVRFQCRPCGAGFGAGDLGEQDEATKEAIHFVPELAHAFLRCPQCGSPDFEVVEGRGVEIGGIEGERDDD